MCKSSIPHSMKHIAIDFYFVPEKVQNGDIRVSHISSKDQLAYALTKSLSHQKLQNLRAKIGALSRDTILRGHIRKIT